MGGCLVVIILLLIISILPFILEAAVWIMGILIAIWAFYKIYEAIKESRSETQRLIKRVALISVMAMIVVAFVYGYNSQEIDINKKKVSESPTKSSSEPSKQASPSNNYSSKSSTSSTSSSTSSLSPSEVYYWIQNRYIKYDDLYEGGEYSGDKYTTEVFLDAADYFGVSVTEVRKAYDSFSY